MTHSQIFSKGKFIKASEDCLSPCFRSVFDGKKGEKTVITICGLGFFKLFINGKNPTEDIFAPVTSFYHEYDRLYCKNKFGEELASRVYVMQYDITDYVIDGINSVCAVVGHAWYFKEYYGECVLCYKIECGEKKFYSDSNVKWIDSPLVFNKDKELEDTFYQMKRGETHDYTKHHYDGSWILPDFDDNGWKNTVETELPDTQYCLQDCPNDRIVRSISPKLVKKADEYSIYDFGENISGWYIFKCPKYGEKVTVVVGELLDENNELDFEHTWDQLSQYTCDGSDREYHPLFTWQGFRYVKITNNAELIRCDVIHTPAKRTADFKCENDVLNWLYETYLRTQICNLHAGIPSDCPHIERLGYTGDGQLTCETAMINFDLKKFYLKWMEDISDCQDRKSGNVQYCAPYWKCGGGPGGWGCAIVEVPYQFYRRYGDSAPIKKYFPQMLKYFEYLDSRSEDFLVVKAQPGEWCLGEWLCPHSPDAEHNHIKFTPSVPDPYINTYFYVRSIDRILQVAEKIGLDEYVKPLKAKREKITEAIIRHYFNDTTGDFANNDNCANAFAVDMGLGDKRTLENLINHVKSSPVDTGIFGTEIVGKVLCENGYSDVETQVLARKEHPSFGYMMSHGATTLWEEWQNPRSMSHPMFGAVTKNLLYYVLGIRQEKNSFGYEKILIDPHPSDVSGDAEGYVELDFGKISVKTDRKSKTAEVSVPAGAEVYAFDEDKKYRLQEGINIIKLK